MNSSVSLDTDTSNSSASVTDRVITVQRAAVETTNKPAWAERAAAVIEAERPFQTVSRRSRKRTVITDRCTDGCSIKAGRDDRHVMLYVWTSIRLLKI